jgi:hypothetical protein
VSNQKKTFIDPSAIVAVRLECNKCGASVSMLVKKEMRFTHLLSRIITCNEPGWHFLVSEEVP